MKNQKAKHPPGPWLIARSATRIGSYANDTGDIEWKVYTEGNMPICSVNATPIKTNARLISAAPELLKGAKAVMDMLKKNGPSIVPHLMDSDENAGQRLRDAIDKAEDK